jgi:hypothetical protein
MILCILSGEPVSSGESSNKHEKDFFFEKKKQKTFAHFGRHRIHRCAPAAMGKSFFGSFFQKRTPSFLCDAADGPAMPEVPSPISASGAQKNGCARFGALARTSRCAWASAASMPKEGSFLAKSNDAPTKAPV